MSEIIPFEIERMDPLGQGVSLTGERVTFIAKTLPGDKGTAKIIEQKGKKVQFATLVEIDEKSQYRESSPCPHFEQCQGCSFLNTSYANESEFKKNAYSFLFKKVTAPEDIKYISSDKRLHYRNRIQLHYSGKRIGYQTRQGILEVPECQLPHPLISEAIKNFYKEGFQQHLPKKSPKEGHIELSIQNGEIQIHCNENYSHGGFRQVHEQMGELARKRVEEVLSPLLKEKEYVLIDLFGGSGYLSKFHKGKKIIADYGEQQEASDNYIDINIYSKYALERFKKKLIKFNVSDLPRIFIVDPPRSGMKDLAKFCEKTDYILYLSCNPQSQVRDIQSLLQTDQWESEFVEFYDFFPATHHLESLVLLKRR